ncbi:hypothetical protein M514_07763 [Trichuris suis]|uniref:Uncharacterized protein n=1 Tax=Trichuris suis TaxID=68888 RepID=A0A085MRV6_9BILA|nr:hypothetical protein M513_07763 [Trichuris suis]KFD59952.1 hypothetical protein M514_07763 [Trichuris suis]
MLRYRSAALCYRNVSALRCIKESQSGDWGTVISESTFCPVAPSEETLEQKYTTPGVPSTKDGHEQTPLD